MDIFYEGIGFIFTHKLVQHSLVSGLRGSELSRGVLSPGIFLIIIQHLLSFHNVLGNKNLPSTSNNL